MRVRRESCRDETRETCQHKQQTLLPNNVLTLDFSTWLLMTNQTYIEKNRGVIFQRLYVWRNSVLPYKNVICYPYRRISSASLDTKTSSSSSSR